MPDVFVRSYNLPIEDGGSALSGLHVSAHTQAGLAASATTGEAANPAGVAFLGNLAAGDYELRLTAPIGSLMRDGNVFSAEVSADDDPQYFDFYVDDRGLPSASSDFLCRCSGVFVDSSGQPVENVRIRLSDSDTPQLLCPSANGVSSGVIPVPRVVVTDKSGYAVVDLIRGGTYSVHMTGYQDVFRRIKVPNLSAASLPDVIFPVVSHIEHTVGGQLINPAAPELELSVGDQIEVSVDTVHRSGVHVDGLVGVEIKSTNEDLFTVVATAGGYTITGLSAGAAEVKASRVEPEKGKGVNIYVEPNLLGTLNVTVVQG